MYIIGLLLYSSCLPILQCGYAAVYIAAVKYSENDLKILGPKIENHELFPERTNVTFAQINDENNITVNVWERGAGLTKACGTAACATAVTAFIKKLTKNDINIKFEEGSLNIKIDTDLNIFMRGPVSEVKHTRLEI